MMAESLANRTIVITRDQDQARNMASAVENLGGRALLFPTIKVSAIADRQACVSAANDINKYDWVVFSSANAVRYFPEFISRGNQSAIACKIAAVGTKTAEELEANGVSVDLVPETYTAKGLLKALGPHEFRDKNILLPVSNIARDDIENGLRSLDADVNRIEVYRTDPNKDLDSDVMQRMIGQKEIDCLTFFSPSAFRFFIEIVGQKTANDIISMDIIIAAIGPTTCHAIESAGFHNVIMPKKNLENELLETIVTHFDNR
jgi:uroporphyrinogen-III synthase